MMREMERWSREGVQASIYTHLNIRYHVEAENKYTDLCPAPIRPHQEFEAVILVACK